MSLPVVLSSYFPRKNPQSTLTDGKHGEGCPHLFPPSLSFSLFRRPAAARLVGSTL